MASVISYRFRQNPKMLSSLHNQAMAYAISFVIDIVFGCLTGALVPFWQVQSIAAILPARVLLRTISKCFERDAMWSQASCNMPSCLINAPPDLRCRSHTRPFTQWHDCYNLRATNTCI